MNRFLSIVSRIPLIGRLVSNYYEGAVWKWGERSFIFGTNQDARLDANSMSRTELMRKARYFDKNNAFAHNLGDKWQLYTVGSSGLQVVSKSTDATDYFKMWGQDCDALGLMTFDKMQNVASRAWFFDGDCFLVKVVVRGRLKIQLIEGHRVYTPPNMSADEGVSVVDGVGIDGNGKVTGIWVNIAPEIPYQATQANAWRFVAIEDVHQIMDPTRSAMYRGVSSLHPILNDLNDLDDLQTLTMQVAKQAATIGNVTNNRTGELPTANSRRSLLKIQSPNGGSSTSTKNSTDWYAVKFGAQEIALQHGDTIKQFQADRPSLAEREHWDYVISKICAGVCISKLLVMPYSIQGTVARADLDVCAAAFRARSAVMQAAVKQVFFWVIGWAEKYDRLVLTGGYKFDGHDDVTVRAPRSPNVDVGRNSKALVAELDAGLRTYQDIYAEAGQDWREQLDQKGIEADLINQLAKKYKIDPNDIAARVSAQTPQSKGNTEENKNDEQTTL